MFDRSVGAGSVVAGAGRWSEPTVERRPRLVDDVEADGARRLVDVRVVDAVHEADRRTLERVLVGQLHAHAPHAALVRRCRCRSRVA